MWRAAVGQNVQVNVDDGGDDWETDPDFENDVSEKEQRWGAKTVAGSGHQEHIDIHHLRETVSTEHTSLKQKELETMPKASHGYGGKFGVQQDRMDKSAVGHDYQSQLSKHCSQTDTSKGFGGKFGVQADRVDQVKTADGVNDEPADCFRPRSGEKWPKRSARIPPIQWKRPSSGRGIPAATALPPTSLCGRRGGHTCPRTGPGCTPPQ